MQKERRNLIQKLEREADRLMEEISSCEAKAKALDDEMGQEAVYTDASRMSAIVREKEDLVTRIEQMNESWFEVSTRLEELRDGQGA